VLPWTPTPRTSGLKSFQSCKAQDIYNADGMDLSFSSLPDQMLPWRNKCRSDAQCCSAQAATARRSTHYYCKVHETTVFKKCKESTCDLFCPIKSVDDDGDFQRLSACS
jgi:hypothetical protein